MKTMSLITLISVLSLNCYAMELARIQEAEAQWRVEAQEQKKLLAKITREEQNLSLAMEKDDLGAVESLLHKVEREGNNRSGITSMHLAAADGYVDVIRFLAGKGFSVNLESTYHIVPLLVAAERPKRAEVITVLCELGALVNFQDSWYKASPLHGAVEFGCLENVKALLEQPKIDATLKNGDGRTPLEEAEALGDAKIIALLKDYAKHVG